MPAGLGRSARAQASLDVPEGGNAEGGVEGDPVVDDAHSTFSGSASSTSNASAGRRRQQGDQRPENDEVLRRCAWTRSRSGRAATAMACVAAWAYRP